MELTNKNETAYPSLIRPISKLLVPKNENQLRLDDDPDSENWNVFPMKKVKVRTFDDKLLFRGTGKIFTVIGAILEKITDDDFNKVNSPDIKQFIDLLHEVHFDIHGIVNKSNRDRTINDYYIKRTILAAVI